MIFLFISSFDVLKIYLLAEDGEGEEEEEDATAREKAS